MQIFIITLGLILLLANIGTIINLNNDVYPLPGRTMGQDVSGLLIRSGFIIWGISLLY